MTFPDHQWNAPRQSLCSPRFMPQTLYRVHRKSFRTSLQHSSVMNSCTLQQIFKEVSIYRNTRLGDYQGTESPLAKPLVRATGQVEILKPVVYFSSFYHAHDKQHSRGLDNFCSVQYKHYKTNKKTFYGSTFVGSAWSFGFFIPATTANDLQLRSISISDLIHYIIFLS